MSRKTLAKSLAAWDSRRLHEENQLRFSNSKDFRFYWAKKHSISEWYFTMRLGVLTLNNRETHVRIVSLDQLGSRRAIADLFVMFISWTSQKASKFINFWVKVGHSAKLKHSNSTWRPWSCDSCEMYKISTSRNGMDLRQLSFWYRALSCWTDWFTKGVYIWATHLHIAVPTITCSLRYA